MLLLSSIIQFLFEVHLQWPENPQAYRSGPKESMNDCKESTIIIGGGIIGFSTAYYLASLANLLNNPHCISVVDSSPAVFVAASGGATGILGDYGFEPEAEALGVLS